MSSVTEAVSHPLPLTAAVLCRPGHEGCGRRADTAVRRRGGAGRGGVTTDGLCRPLLRGLSPDAPLQRSFKVTGGRGGHGGPQDRGKLAGHTRWNLSPELVAAAGANRVSLRRWVSADALAVVCDRAAAPHPESPTGPRRAWS